MWTYDLASVGEIVCVISGFRREIDEDCALLDYYADSCGNSLSNPICFLERSVINCH